MLDASHRNALVSGLKDLWNSFGRRNGQVPLATTVLSWVPNYDFPHTRATSLKSFPPQRFSLG